MPMKSFKPYTPSRRAITVEDFSDLTKKAPEKALLQPLRKSGGRNNTGSVMVRFRGGGHKRMYRVVDFKRDKFGVPAKVAAIEYDPNRSARLALLHYKDGAKRYILHPVGLAVGDTVMSGPTAEIKTGNALPLANIPIGTVVHAVELIPGNGAQMARSAGASIQIMARENGYATLKMPSGEIRMVPDAVRGDGGPGGQHRTRKFDDRQRGAQPPPRVPVPRARHGHERRRPPARRRPRPVQGQQPAPLALEPTGEGVQDPVAQKPPLDDRPPAHERRGTGLRRHHVAFQKERAVHRLEPRRERSRSNARPATRSPSRPGRARAPSPRTSSASSFWFTTGANTSRCS
jgi:ribosomal protein L2